MYCIHTHSKNKNHCRQDLPKIEKKKETFLPVVVLENLPRLAKKTRNCPGDIEGGHLITSFAHKPERYLAKPSVYREPGPRQPRRGAPRLPGSGRGKGDVENEEEISPKRIPASPTRSGRPCIVQSTPSYPLRSPARCVDTLERALGTVSTRSPSFSAPLAERTRRERRGHEIARDVNVVSSAPLP